MESVVITGMGIVSAAGMGISEFCHNLYHGKSGIGYSEESIKNQGIPYAACICEQQISDRANDLQDEITRIAGSKTIKRILKRGSIGLRASILAALEAYQMAEISCRYQDQTALIICGNNINQSLMYNTVDGFRANPEYLSPTYALQFMDTDHLGTLSEIFQIRGEGMSVGGASASGNVGIVKGYQLLRGRSDEDICMVVGSLMDLSPIELQGFSNIGAMGGRQPGKTVEIACNPFDVTHDGFIYGQASACVILEKKSHAVKRNAPVLAELLGGSIVLDGNRLSNPNVKGEVKAMENAISVSGISKADIDYLNCHGSSSPLGDETELAATQEVFNEHLEHIYINSSKSITGHCLTSAGVVELIAVILQMKEEFLHPNVHLRNPIRKQFRFCPNHAIGKHIRYAMSNSFGFGGINSSILIGRA